MMAPISKKNLCGLVLLGGNYCIVMARVKVLVSVLIIAFVFVFKHVVSKCFPSQYIATISLITKNICNRAFVPLCCTCFCRTINVSKQFGYRRGVDAFAFSVVRVGDDGLSTGFVSRFYPPSNNDTYITELLASEAAVNEILGTSDLGSESDIKKVINIIRDYSINTISDFNRETFKGRSGVESDTIMFARESVIRYELERQKIIAREFVHKNRKLIETIANELCSKKILLFSDALRIYNSLFKVA